MASTTSTNLSRKNVAAGKLAAGLHVLPLALSACSSAGSNESSSKSTKAPSTSTAATSEESSQQ